MKKTLHIIPHSHWDREWYISFEEHRMRLVELIDSIIEKMEKDESFPYFHLDGQTIVIEDYLEIRPEMRERLFALIKANRIQVGPWYVLQDEFLTSGESNIRNMTEGLKYCRENKFEPVMTGYMPDAFGNISQLPQILSGFGIDNAVFGRGTGIIFADNIPAESENKAEKELIWQGADDSEVIGIMFTNWYNNANELPTEKNAVKEVYGKLISDTSAASVTDHLLAMNGCDHQPLQKDLPESIEAARELFGDEVEILHSNFKDYIKDIRPYSDKFTHINGELCSQKTSGECLLTDTASTHIPLKLKNHKCQNLLTEQAEPVSVLAQILGDTYRGDMLRYSWKKLMQCHPHDSICCCSCDDVTREMSIRFDKSRQTAEYVLGEAAAYVSSRVDTSALGDCNIVVFHTGPKKTDSVITALVYTDNFTEADSLTVVDAFGKAIPCTVNYKGLKFTYTLPKDSFRKVFHKHCYEVRFPVTLEGIGCFVYSLKKSKPAEEKGVIADSRNAENSLVKLHINDDGTFDITDKRSGKAFIGLNAYEDTGDCGDSYNYCQSKDGKVVYRKGQADIKLINSNDFSAAFEIKQTINIPKGLTDNKERTSETIPHVITTRVTLNANSPRVEVETEFVNNSENHRLRALFKNDIKTDTVFADGQFDVVKRDITPWSGWTNPSNTQRMQSFFGIEDDNNGLLVAVKGLCEYEALRDGKNTLALTLLRSVGEVGDWGVFPAPEMQLLGKKMVLNYAVIPYCAENKADAFDSAYAFAGDFTYAYQTDRHSGSIAPNTPFVTVKGDYSVFSALKSAENRNGTILRIYSVSEQTENIEIEINNSFIQSAFETKLDETNDIKLDVVDSKITLAIPPKKIKTFRII